MCSDILFFSLMYSTVTLLIFLKKNIQDGKLAVKKIHLQYLIFERTSSFISIWPLAQLYTSPGEKGRIHYLLVLTEN